MEFDANPGYPSSDDLGMEVCIRAIRSIEALTEFAQAAADAVQYSKELISLLPTTRTLCLLPPEWPMARLLLTIPRATAEYKRELYCATIQRRLEARTHTRDLHSDDILAGLDKALYSVATLIASLFKQIASVDFVKQFNAWLLFEQVDFWYKSLVIELQVALQSVRKHSKERWVLDATDRTQQSFTTFVVLHDHNSNLAANMLPVKDVKVYFPMTLLDVVLTNAQRLGFAGSYQDKPPSMEAIVVKTPTSNNVHEKPYYLVTLKQGHAPVPLLYSPATPIAKYASARRLLSTGLLSVNVTEALTHLYQQTKLQIELKSPTSYTAQRDDDDLTPLAEDCPSRWELMQATPGQLMSIGAFHLHSRIPNRAIRDRYATKIVQGLDLPENVNKNLDTLFHPHAKAGDPNGLTQRYDCPEYGLPSDNNTHQRFLGWFYGLQTDMQWPATEATQRLGELINSPLVYNQTFQPWTQAA